MLIEPSESFDVLIVGSGIAGLSAAVESAKTGCRTAVISSTHIFSGSSFYPGTWGFGLVGPDGEDDIPDLERSIQTVGCGMADASLVHTFVSNIQPAISYIKEMGCKMKEPEKSGEAEFIPCFDHKHRSWHGLYASSLRETFSRAFQQNGVCTYENCTLLQIVRNEKRVSGAIVFKDGDLHYLKCKSLVLATGGYGALFKHHLCPDDVCGIGHFLALEAGCSLINMEFMQTMLGFVSPAYGTVFNEKTYRYTDFFTEPYAPVFTAQQRQLLQERSSYGPYTCRLPSGQIDRIIYKCNQYGTPVFEKYLDVPQTETPEFVELYFDWLLEKKSIQRNTAIQVSSFSHASNGGIQIDSDGYTGVPGLYACGEVTGGMHGADRIGGLSTANGLVFGQRAGRAASAYAHTQSFDKEPATVFKPLVLKNRAAVKQHLQEIMFQNALVIRNSQGLSEADSQLQKILDAFSFQETAAIEDVVASRLLYGELMTARCILKAALYRTESRGSHYREDYPQESDFPQVCKLYMEGSSLKNTFTTFQND